jgi:Asp-tRNA(Asn)/Glu-tRNA(Gln) amidotransferase C subunit
MGMWRDDARKIKHLLDWLEKQRHDHAGMVTDAGDSSLWSKDEAEKIRGHIQTVIDMNEMLIELDFLRHEGGEQSVAAMETTMRDTVLPLLRRTAEDLLRCVSVSADPATIRGQDWRDIAEDLEAVLAVERFVGRPDDDYGRVLNPVLDAASWRAHL